MTVAPAVKPRPQATLTVLRTQWLGEHMVRVIAGGHGFSDFTANGFTDMYVKIHFPHPDVDYPQPLDVFALREFLPRDQWPATRTYTVRWVNLTTQELAIDFVVHGDEGLAGPWA
ncbi:MAG TPA: siderophore-interacting protein, partial [Micrococcaceae bacterium]|nr:siderophore-interacting protein [Micrococcaceae bacterium]